MNGEAVNAIVSVVRKPIELGGFLYRPTDWTVEDPQALIKPSPKAPTFTVSTLGALRDYLVANRDALDLAKLVVHVESPNKVTVSGELRSRSRDREVFIAAEVPDLTNGFIGKYHELEDVIIGLQCRFVDADRRQELLQLLSNVRSESVNTSMDDGVSQVLETRAGVHLKGASALPNPVQLTAFRTFRDIPQPSSPYVVRAQEGPTIMLVEADGQAWKLSTIAKIRDWLAIELGSITPAIAILA